MSAELEALGLAAAEAGGMTDDDRIVARRPRNPFAAGTPEYARRENMRSGMRVGDYVALVGDRRAALSDLLLAHRAGTIGIVAAPSREVAGE